MAEATTATTNSTGGNGAMMQHATLIPSQAIDARSSSSGSNSKQNNNKNTAPGNTEPQQSKAPRKRNNNNRNKKNGPKPKGQEAQTQPQPQSEGGTGNNNANNGGKKKRNNRGRNKNKNNNTNNPQQQHQQQQQNGSNNNSDNNGNNNNNKPKQRNKNNRNKRKKYPWRKFIPPNSEDPITLESLHSLPYPPFALYATPPYEPIPVWPFPSETTSANNNNNNNRSTTPSKNPPQQQQDPEALAKAEKERQERILREQWGEKALTSSQDGNDHKGDENTGDKKPAAITNENENEPSLDKKDRHVHLFDGRALSYYMVSQLQFIDPLNRRDLTRDEILSLDTYLRRHGFSNTNVSEAYDAKGVTISRAGSAATTASGRAAILQQEARVLYNSLFGLGVPTTGTSSNNENNAASGAAMSALAQGYQAHEQREQQQVRSRNNQNNSNNVGQQDDTGIDGDSGGILVIDDDLNPGLRGTDINSALRSNAAEFVPATGGAPATGASTNFSQWSASQIGARLGHQAQARATDFPALRKPTEPPRNDGDNNKPKKNLPKSNTLANIAGSVKKTDPEERQRMWEAHEAFIRKARMANLTFGGEAPPATTVSDAPPIGTISLDNMNGNEGQPSDGQLERNRNLAEALGVQPSTARGANNPNIMSKSGWARPSIGEYGNELNSIVYPEELLAQARERMGLLAKLEKRWALFLEDDKSSSLPLWPMDRPTRVFVHHYSDFWKLNTESFDAEPKRYIHCVKLLDTRAPSPLLSEAARKWTAPKQPVTPTLSELPRYSGAAQTSTTATSTDSSRWDHLDPTPTRERPKLELKQRTLPLELPPAPAPASDFFSEEERRARQDKIQERARKEREKVEAQKRALEAAFASDSEEDDDDNDDDGNGSDWTQDEEELQDFSDEEGM